MACAIACNAPVQIADVLTPGNLAETIWSILDRHVHVK